MERIGIMGGTFNPIHNAHLIMAEEARMQFHLDRILFMPSKNPPHKNKRNIVSDAHRTRMIQHAICDHPYFEYSDIELKREGITYTRDTLAILKNKLPESDIYFILGGDSLEAMETWRDPAYIFLNCHILVANRDHIAEEKIQQWADYYKKQYHADISEVRMPSISISSEFLRNKLAQGESISDYCPSCVEAYIRNNALYGVMGSVCHAQTERERLCHVLAACLKPKRYGHTLGVAVTAANLAAVHGANPDQAYLAGLLHDCAKYLNGDEMIQLCEENGLTLSAIERENTALIHGKLGACFARTKYEVLDEDILAAISYHTTGRPKMSLLEKIIYLADYMEPNRDMKCKPYSLKKIRKTCFVDLDAALCMVLKNTVDYLEKSGSLVDEMTMKTYTYYRKGKGENQS